MSLDQGRPRPLTLQARDRLAAVIGAGDYTVDATVGNGHDTLFLAGLVGDTGHVWGFDIQPAALENTRRQLAEHGLSRRVSLVEAGHEHLEQHLPVQARGKLAAVMFNLGYLPGSDKQVTTRPDTTLAALQAALANLRPGGLLSVLAYRGHEGGLIEAGLVEDWLLARQAGGCELERIESPGPVLFLLTRR